MSVTVALARDFARMTDEQLLQIHHEERDVAAREELVERFMPFARKLAHRYMHTTEPMPDLVQVASIGLLNAIDRFEPGLGRPFTAYAAPTIVGELKRHFRDKGWSMHVPRDLQERALAVSRHSERLSSELGRTPTVEELSRALECTAAQTVEAMGAAHNYHPVSLDTPVDQDEEDSCPLADTLGIEEDGFDLAHERQALAANWGKLSAMERQVVGLRLGQGLTQREISRQIGYSQMHVSRVLRKSLLHLEAEGELASAM